MSLIDLRSDTVTRPTPGMREAMASAAVGDDQFGEDPTVNALQERIAGLLGKEAALWLPTGTMANQVALRVLTRPGDHVVVSRESHAVWHETGGAGANAGVQLTEIGTRGVIHRGGVRGGVQSAARTCCFRRRRSSKWRIPTTVRAESCFHKPTRNGSARRRASAVWQATSMERGSGTPRLQAVARRRASRRRSISYRSRSRKVLAPRAGRCWQDRGRRSTPPSAIGACLVARCGRWASSPPPDSTRSTITWNRLVEDHDNAARIARRLGDSRESGSAPFRRTSSSSALQRMPPTDQRSSRGPGSAVCWPSPSVPGRSVSSRISTCRVRSVNGRRKFCSTSSADARCAHLRVQQRVRRSKTPDYSRVSDPPGWTSQFVLTPELSVDAWNRVPLHRAVHPWHEEVRAVDARAADRSLSVRLRGSARRRPSRPGIPLRSRSMCSPAISTAVRAHLGLEHVAVLGYSIRRCAGHRVRQTLP